MDRAKMGPAAENHRFFAKLQVRAAGTPLVGLRGLTCGHILQRIKRRATKSQNLVSRRAPTNLEIDGVFIFLPLSSEALEDFSDDRRLFFFLLFFFEFLIYFIAEGVATCLDKRFSVSISIFFLN